MKAKTLTPVVYLLALLTAACDGGISGTGGISEFMGAPELDSQAPVEMVDAMPLASDIAFTNTADTTLRPDAIYKLVNGVIGIGPISARINDGAVEPSLPATGNDFAEGGALYSALPADTYNFDVVPTSQLTADPEAVQIAGINPMVLNAGTSTTAILRGSLDATLNAPVEMFAIGNVLGTNNTSTIQIRIIHAAPAFDAAGAVDIHIDPANAGQPASGFPVFEDATYSTGDIGFVELASGSYVITATDADGVTQRIPTTDPITPSPGSSTTFIVLDDPDGVAGVDVILVPLNDGDRSGLP